MLLYSKLDNKFKASVESLHVGEIFPFNSIMFCGCISLIDFFILTLIIFNRLLNLKE